LLLEAVLKYTPDDNPDKKTLPKVIEIIKDFLQKVNLESGKCENTFNLRQINKGLTWKSEPMVRISFDACFNQKPFDKSLIPLYIFFFFFFFSFDRYRSLTFSPKTAS